MTDSAPDIDDDLPPDEPKVFLSYSRKDRERAQGIADALRSRHFGVFRDTDDILPTEEWRERLQQLIEEADTIVFLMSPQSVASEVCAWEVEYATSLNKRIAPIVIQDVEGDEIPPLLARLNFIFCTDRDPFENAINTLSSALSTDIDWVREHTRLSGLARRWQDAGRPKRLLLRGQDIADAETWRDSRPKDSPDITTAHVDLIRASRKAAQARQRGWIAGSLVIALITAGLSVFAVLQSFEADRQRIEAEVQRAEAEVQRAEADRQRAEAEFQRATAESERDRAEEERLRAEEQRDLAEKRLREALIERTRRNLADASSMMAEGAQQRAAPMVVDALESAIGIADPGLLQQAETVARELLFSDRLIGFLEKPLLLEYGFADLRISPDGLHIAALSQDDLTVWAFATGDKTPAAVAEVEAMAWLPDNRLAVIRSTLQNGIGGGLTILDPATGKVVANTDYDRQFADAQIFAKQNVAVVSEYLPGGIYRTLGLQLSDGAVLFDLPSGERFRAAAVSDDGLRIALAHGKPEKVSVLDRDGGLLADHVAEASSLMFAPGTYALTFQTGRDWWLWPSSQVPRPLEAGGETADQLTFLSDGRMLLRAGQDQVAIAQADDPANARTLPVARVFGLAGTANAGARFILRLDQQFAVHDSTSGDLIHRVGHVSPPLGGFHLSQDGHYLAIVHQDGSVSVWSTESGRELLALKPEGGGKWISILDRPSGPVLAVVDGSDRLGLWRIEPYDLFFSAESLGASAPIGDQVAVTGSFLQPLRMWDLAAGVPTRVVEGGVLVSADAATGRQLVRLTGTRAGIMGPGAGDPVLLQTGKHLDGWAYAWGADGHLAVHSRGVVEVFDTGTGTRVARLETGEDRSRPVVKSMAFLAADQLAVLMHDSRLLVASIGKDDWLSQQQLPGKASRMVVSGSGRFAMIAHDEGVWRHDFRSGITEPFAQQDSTVGLRAAGPKSVVLHWFDGETRRSWLVDMETGKTRFDLDWGSTFAMGADDRFIVSEDARGGFAIIDAQGGEVLHQLRGDGGVGGFPVRPYLSADERWMIGVNGGSDMLRLIDTSTGQVRARVARREGFTGLLQPSPDFSAVTLTEGIRSAVVDLRDTQLGTEDLLAILQARNPVLPDVPEAQGVTRCDRMAAFSNDPMARADGVPYDDISPEALSVCGQLVSDGDADAVTLFQLARAASLHAPDQDPATVKLLTGLADQGYAAASYTLAVLMLQGRAPGDLETLVRHLKEAGDHGAGIAWVMLSRLAAAGHIDEDANELLRTGAEANLPAAMDEFARHLAADGRDMKAAADLAFQAAVAYAGRHQTAAAQLLMARAGRYARRYRP